MPYTHTPAYSWIELFDELHLLLLTLYMNSVHKNTFLRPEDEENITCLLWTCWTLLSAPCRPYIHPCGLAMRPLDTLGNSNLTHGIDSTATAVCFATFRQSTRQRTLRVAAKTNLSYIDLTSLYDCMFHPSRSKECASWGSVVGCCLLLVLVVRDDADSSWIEIMKKVLPCNSLLTGRSFIGDDEAVEMTLLLE